MRMVNACCPLAELKNDIAPIPEMIPNENSKDISLLPVQMYDIEAKTVIHHSDTVTVIVACSMKPVVADHSGLIRLSNILTSVEERLFSFSNRLRAHGSQMHKFIFQTITLGS